MDIYVEDMTTPKLESYDIFKESGNMQKIPLIETLTVSVSDNDGLQIKLQAIVDDAKINAIVISTIGGGGGPSPMLTPAPTPAPVIAPTPAPVFDSAMPVETIGPTPGDGGGFVLRLNAAGPSVYDDEGRLWENDNPFRRKSDGTVSTNVPIVGTPFETIYQTAQYGTELSYRIPVPEGDYNVIFHFAEIEDVAIGERIFDISAEDPLVITGADIAATAGQFSAVVINKYVPAVDELLVIRFIMPEGSVYKPMVSALEVIQNFPHLAHAVPGGPYMAVDRDNTGRASVPVSGFESHTHQPGAFIDSWKWFLDGLKIAEGHTANLNLDVGTHTILLKVEDTDGHTSIDSAIVVVEPYGFPFIDSISPENGEIGDPDYSVTLTGVGFLGADLVVHFGPENLHGGTSAITVVSDTELIINAPVPSVRSTTGPVYVFVETAIGVSNTEVFTQYDEPFFFDLFDIVDGETNQPYYLFQPTSVTIGPDEKLYVGTRSGEIHKLTVGEDWIVTDAVVSTAVSDQSNDEDDKDRAVLGMTFDPLDTSDPPTLYVTTSILGHDGEIAWEGRAINGRVVAVTGENLDTLTNVITGLPTLDRDHCVNGIEFGDHGELYINNGGNTNAGVPGFMSGSQVQEEGYLSGALNVAHLSREFFDGHVTYNGVGDKVGGIDVEGFAYGTRNPYDLVLHSNGFIYGTDNGPNKIYGEASVDCDTEGWAEPAGQDELNLLEHNKYYGHPNRKRGEVDPRQCTYHHPDEGSGAGFTGPMAVIPSSVDGIIEFRSNHFGGGMRGQLVIGQFRGAMYRVPLTPDGRGIVNDEVIPFLDFGGLDVTQAPNGSLISTRYNDNKIIVQVPIEDPESDLEIKSVFPHRGHLSGGSRLSVYGVNMDTGSTPVVRVGSKICGAVIVESSTKLTCTLPSYGTPRKANVMVDNGLVTKTYTEAYRYITGEEE